MRDLGLAQNGFAAGGRALRFLRPGFVVVQPVFLN